MIRFIHRPAARLALAALVLGLAVGAAPGLRPSVASADNFVVHHDGNRLALDTPFLHLEFDLRHPALDILRVAPNGDWQHGGSIGAITDEVTAGGKPVRSSADDADGARASWQSESNEVRIQIDGIDDGSLATSTWLVTVPLDSPSLHLDRLTSLHAEAGLESLGLAVVGPSVPEGINPASLARMLNEGTYRPEVGPPSLERSGWMLGLLAVDNPELTFSARTDQPNYVAVRQEGANTSLAFVRRLTPPARSGQLREGIVFHFGWGNDYLSARSDAQPDIERRLLASGYYGNSVISPILGTVLSASMRDYRGSVWSRDSDYALQGYSYVLDDLTVFGNTLQKLLERVDNNGVAPEYILLDGQYGNRQAWDSMANVVQGAYTYVARTGDLDFYRRNEASVKKALNWIRALDTNGDGLPDRDVFPFGYTDTVENGPLHTYAIAKFYATFLAVAELDEAIGKDGRPWRAYARAMQTGFSRPSSAGGYWNPQTGYPIAWKRANGQVFAGFESFGIFEAIRVGLLTDASQLESIAAWLDANRGAFVNSNPYPERLMIGGYDLRVKKSEVPLDKLWIMDCNAPWITGLSVPARVQLGRLEAAREMLDVYASSANRPTPHAEFGAGPLGVYGPGETLDGGRLWDNWSWFSAIYGTHFGLKMTIPALEVAPAPLDPVVGRHLFGVNYQGARIDMELLDGGYRITLDAPKRLLLRPPYGARLIDVNGDADYQPWRSLIAQPGLPYLVQGHQ